MTSTAIQSIVVGAIGVVISLILTFIFNGIVNLPKKKKKQQEMEAEKERIRKKEISALTESIEKINQNIQTLNEEITSQREKDDQIVGDLELIKAGLQSVIKSELKEKYEYWVHEKYAPGHAKDDLERMYQTYHKLGANGVMDALRAQFMTLPNEPPENI